MEQKLSTKVIIAAVVGVIVLGALAWFAIHKKQTAPTTSVPPGFVPPYTNPPGGKPQPEGLEDLRTHPVINFGVLQERASPGDTVVVNWAVTYPTPPGHAQHGALHWDTKTHFAVSQDQLSETTYAHAEGQFISTESVIPRTFSASLIVPPSVPAVYVRVDAVVDGVRYWSAEKFITVVTP